MKWERGGQRPLLEMVGGGEREWVGRSGARGMCGCLGGASLASGESCGVRERVCERAI